MIQIDSLEGKISTIQGDYSGGDALGFLRFKREGGWLSAKGSEEWEYLVKEDGGKWDWDDDSS